MTVRFGGFGLLALVGLLTAISPGCSTTECNCGVQLDVDVVSGDASGDALGPDAQSDVDALTDADGEGDGLIAVGGDEGILVGFDTETEATPDAALDAEVDSIPDATLDAEVEVTPVVCGDGIVAGLEQCDLGDDNGPNSNCLINCALNPTQRVTLGEEFMGMYEGQSAVDGQTDATLSFMGTGSWATTPDDDTNSDGADKFELFLDTGIDELAFIGPYTVDDIQEVFFVTHKPVAGGANFYLQIYTAADGVDDSALWYGYRLTGEPRYAANGDDAADQWNLWSTTEGANQLTFYDQANLNAYGVASGQPSLSELQGTDAFDWSGVHTTGDVTAIDYGAEKVQYLAIMVSEGASDDFVGNIDHVGLLLKDGRGVIVDLEP